MIVGNITYSDIQGGYAGEGNIDLDPGFVDAASGDLYELLWDLYRQSYDITADDSRLREHPEAFESLRGNYPLRREPQAYSVRLFQGYKEIEEINEALGFSMLADQCS